MTEEQIKQNAEAYANKSRQYYLEVGCYEWICDAHEAGAHSLDEEIEQLKTAISSAQKAMAELAEMVRNPWSSIEKHPDDVTKDYLLEYEDGSHIVAIWDSGMWMSKNLHPLKEPIRWMPIPQIEKGE